MFRLRDYGIEPDIVIVSLVAVIAIMLILLIILLVKTSGLKNRYMNFMEGKDGKSLEESFQKKFENMDYVNEELKKIDWQINNINENLMHTYQKVGIVKYDAFKEIGRASCRERV